MGTETPRPILEAFDLIKRYAERENWIPIGRRTFMVGRFEITVNGTGTDVDGVPAYHAKVIDTGSVGVLLMSPFQGQSAGYTALEAHFIDTTRAALARGASELA